MKIIFFVMLLLLYYLPITAQIECGTDEYIEMMERQYPEIRLIREHNRWKELFEDYDNHISPTFSTTKRFEIIAPVVFHVIHHPQLGITIDMKPSNKVIGEQLGILENKLTRNLNSNIQTDTLAKIYLTNHLTAGIYYEKLNKLFDTHKTLLHEEARLPHNSILPQNNLLDWNKLVAYRDDDGCIAHFIATQEFVVGEITAQNTINNKQATEMDKFLALQNELLSIARPTTNNGKATSAGGSNDSVSVQKMNYSLTQLANKQQNNAIVNFKLNTTQANHTVWLDRDSIAAGSSIIVNSIHLKPNPQQAVRPIVYLIDNQGNLLSMIDTLRPITPAKDTVQFSQCALRTYHKLWTGQYKVRVQYDKQVFFLPIFIYNATATPPVGRIEQEIQPTTVQLENYPNPFSNETLIKYYLPQTTNGFLIIRNAMGEVMQTIAIQADKGWHEYKLNTELWANGLYFCTLSVNGMAKTRKLLVIK
jgi:hypothetical protein